MRPSRSEEYASLFRRGADVRTIAEHCGVNTPAVRRGLAMAGLWPTVKIPGRRQRVADTPQGYRERSLARQEEEQRLLNMVVDRDPCPRCGVRRDVGCGHTAQRLAL